MMRRDRPTGRQAEMHHSASLRSPWCRQGVAMTTEEVSGRWALHSALAWILGRSGSFVAQAMAVSFSPALAHGSGATPSSAEDEAWTQLHRLMSDERLPLASHTLVRIRAFGEIDDRPGSIELAPALIAQLGWGIDDGEVVLVSTASETKVRKVTVPIGEVTRNFPATGIPMLPMERLVGAPQDPGLPGSMPLSSAAYWIASTASSAALRMDDRDAWRSAYVELRDRIVSGEVRLIGRPKSGAVPEAISGVHLAGLEIELAWMLTSGEVFNSTTIDRPRIHCAGVVSNDEWIAGDTDELWGRRYGEKLFTHLEVMNQDVARLWPRTSESAMAKGKDASSPIDVCAKTGVEQLPPPLPVRGGISGKRLDDEPLFREMAELRLSGRCKSTADAARAVVIKAGGGGTVDSKVARLSRGYSTWSKSMSGIR